MKSPRVKRGRPSAYYVRCWGCDTPVRSNKNAARLRRPYFCPRCAASASE